MQFLIDNADVVTREETPEFSDDKLHQKLTSYGLAEHEIDILLDRYVSRLSLEEIAIKGGFLSRKTVWRLLQDVTARLRKSPEFKEVLSKLVKETNHGQ